MTEQTLELIGLGARAQVVAVRAAGFDSKLVTWVRHSEKYAATAERLGVTPMTVNEVLSNSDFVSLKLSLTAETR